MGKQICNRVIVVLTGVFVSVFGIGEPHGPSPKDADSGMYGSVVLAQEERSIETEGCNWVLIRKTEYFPSYFKFSHRAGIFGESFTAYNVSVTPGTGPDTLRCDGRGKALDSGFPYEARCQRAVTGYISRSYQNLSAETCPGTAYFSGDMRIEGVANLLDADCAAAALGYVQLTSNISPEWFVKLDKSAGETVAKKLLGLGFSYTGLSVQIEPMVSYGLGEYHDQDAFSADAFANTDFFTFTSRARTFIGAWANATIFSAACDCEMHGETHWLYKVGCRGD